MKILLVEDDPVARETYQAILTAQGHDVVTAENGRAAWDRWLLTRFRLIVADWLMPDMDGLELMPADSREAPGSVHLHHPGHGPERPGTLSRSDAGRA